MLEEYVAVFKVELSHRMQQQDGCLENICSAFSVMAMNGMKLGLEKINEVWSYMKHCHTFAGNTTCKAGINTNFEVILDMFNVYKICIYVASSSQNLIIIIIIIIIINTALEICLGETNCPLICAQNCLQHFSLFIIFISYIRMRIFLYHTKSFIFCSV
jgi:hypothetical protein